MIAKFRHHLRHPDFRVETEQVIFDIELGSNNFLNTLLYTCILRV